MPGKHPRGFLHRAASRIQVAICGIGHGAAVEFALDESQTPLRISPLPSAAAAGKIRRYDSVTDTGLYPIAKANNAMTAAAFRRRGKSYCLSYPGRRETGATGP